MIFTNLIETNLKTSFIGRKVEYYTFTDSTNDDAADIIKNSEQQNGMIIITDYQKNGRGRRNNKWISSPGNNLTFSLILKENDKEKIHLLSILSGIAVVRGIKKFAHIECSLKWPNDIILNKKKIGGILIETKKTSEDTYAIIVIGLNVNQQEVPKELHEIASSLQIEESKPVQREPLLAFILNEFEILYNSDRTQWINTWKEYCVHLNKTITINNNNQLIKGSFVDIDSCGNAIIKTDSEQLSVSTGVIELS